MRPSHQAAKAAVVAAPFDRGRRRADRIRVRRAGAPPGSPRRTRARPARPASARRRAPGGRLRPSFGGGLEALAHGDRAEAKIGREPRSAVLSRQVAGPLVTPDRRLEEALQPAARRGLAAGRELRAIHCETELAGRGNRLAAEAGHGGRERRERPRRLRLLAQLALPGPAIRREDAERPARLGEHLAALEDHAVLGREHPHAEMPGLAHDGCVAPRRIGRGIAVEAEQIGARLAQQLRDDANRIAAAQQERPAARGEIAREALQAIEQEAHARRPRAGRAQDPLVEHEDGEQRVRFARSLRERGVVAQPQVVAEPVERERHEPREPGARRPRSDPLRKPPRARSSAGDCEQSCGRRRRRDAPRRASAKGRAASRGPPRRRPSGRPPCPRSRVRRGAPRGSGPSRPARRGRNGRGRTPARRCRRTGSGRAGRAGAASPPRASRAGTRRRRGAAGPRQAPRIRAGDRTCRPPRRQGRAPDQRIAGRRADKTAPRAPAPTTRACGGERG